MENTCGGVQKIEKPESSGDYRKIGHSETHKKAENKMVWGCEEKSTGRDDKESNKKGDQRE